MLQYHAFDHIFAKNGKYSDLVFFAFLQNGGRGHWFRIAVEISSSMAISGWVIDQIRQHHIFNCRPYLRCTSTRQRPTCSGCSWQKAFPSTGGNDFNRLLKGCFFQALLSKWQRKLSAPKPSETFQELFDRARTLEQHEKQYNAASVTVHGEKNEKPVQQKQTRFTKSPQNKKQPALNQSVKQRDDSEPRPEQSPSASGGYHLRACCHRCGHKGHLARNCQITRPKQESPGCSDNPKEASVDMIGAESGFTEAQLEEMLARCRLCNEQELVGDAYTNTHSHNRI